MSNQERCDVWDLPVDQCACPKHRGEPKAPLDDVETVGYAFVAEYHGECVRCDGRIIPGDRLVRTKDRSYAHFDIDDCFRP